MNRPSPSILRLPHASAGPFWSAPSVEPSHEWHEIEALLAMPASDARSALRGDHSVRNFTLVAAALVFGGGVLAATLMGPRIGCGAACGATTAETSAKSATPRAVDTAALAPALGTNLVEGRSVAVPAPDITAAADAADGAATDPTVPTSPPLPHRRHHHHRHGVQL